MKKPVFLLFLLMAFHRNFSQCSATAATVGASFGNDASIGSLSWSSTANAMLADNNYASASQLVALLSSVQTKYITAQNFGFSIPAAASICGIVVEVQRHAAGLVIGSSITDNSIRIIKNGSITGGEHATGSGWPGSDAYAAYGSSSDQWGAAWTPADINAANFGVAISAKLNAGLAGVFLTADIDIIRITVYYDFLLPTPPLYFRAEEKPAGMQLTWAIPPGTQANYFIVEKSTDAHTWYRLDSISATGMAATTTNYQLLDPTPSAIGYYRLKHAGDAGNLVTDYVISAKYNSQLPKTARVYMDAASHRAVIQCEEAIKTLQLFDLNMRPMRSNAVINGATATVGTTGLPPGLYIAGGLTQANKVFAVKLLLR